MKLKVTKSEHMAMCRVPDELHVMANSTELKQTREMISKISVSAASIHC